MSKVVLLFLAFVLGVGTGWGLFNSGIISSEDFESPLGAEPTQIPTPLYRYSFEKLREKKFSPLKIELTEKIKEEKGFEQWLFKFETEAGTISGQANIPKAAGGNLKHKYPVIIMIRGYVDQEEYKTGAGTKNAAAYFAGQGLITLAPDFLGYGTSDQAPANELESRFARPAAILQLIASLSGGEADVSRIADGERLGLWGHSNGGQIALSVLEISGRSLPTTLWAPVSKPFPYSILYYTDELDDRGKYLRRLTADFEFLYDAEEFSITNYFDWITAPIRVHQGTADDAVPWRWSVQLTKELQKRKLDIVLYQYPGGDHNLRPFWNTVAARDAEFFRKNLKK